MGGQTGLTLSMQLAKERIFEEATACVCWAPTPETIDKAEDRQMFKDTMESIGQPVYSVRSGRKSWRMRWTFAKEIGYPVIVRPAFTLGGTGGGIAKTKRS